MFLDIVSGSVKSALSRDCLFISNRLRHPIAFCYGIAHLLRLGTVVALLLHATLHLLPIQNGCKS